MNLKLSPITIISLSIIILTSVIFILFKEHQKPVKEVNNPPTNEISTNPNSSVVPEETKTNDSPVSTNLETNNFYIAKNVVDLYSQPDQNSERVTQGLHGEPVKIMEKNGDWLKVSLADQFDYSGWLKQENIINLPSQKDWHNLYIVAVPQTQILTEPNGDQVIENLTIGTIVQGDLSSELTEFTKINLVNGIKGYIKNSDLLKYTQKTGLEVSSAEILNTAKQLLNQPYLWGGMSTDGVDCSGFVHTVFKVHGIRLHRDADLQYQYDGVSVTQNDLKAGDLVFFETYKSGASHLGIYVGDRQFINAASSLGVSYASLDNPYYAQRYLGAKRILK